MNGGTFGGALALAVLVALVHIPPAHAVDPWLTKGLLGRQGERWYRPPIDDRHRTEAALPPVDVAAFRRPWGPPARVRLDALGLLEGWGGGDLEAARPVTRWEVAYLMGRFATVIPDRLGRLADTRLEGPRRVATPPGRWGDRAVRAAVRAGLFPIGSDEQWWDRGISRGRFVRFLEVLVRRVEGRTPLVELPLSFPPPGSGAGVPLQGDPRWPLLRRIHRLGLVDMGVAGWDVRAPTPLGEALNAMSRLVFVAEGYREPAAPPAPAPEHPLPAAR